MVCTTALINMLEGKDQEPDAVSLSTLHAAKGLEFPHVFIAGAEEDILLFRDSGEKQIEEERCLMYVGITRAERSLQISYLNRCKRGKDWLACEPSRFLEEAPEGELVYVGDHKEDAPTVSKGEGMAKLKAMLNKEPGQNLLLQFATGAEITCVPRTLRNCAEHTVCMVGRQGFRLPTRSGIRMGTKSCSPYQVEVFS